MTTTSRTAFLARVAAAVRSGNKHRESMPEDMAPSAGYVGAGGEPVQRLIDELTKVGAFPVLARSRDELIGAIRTLVATRSIRTALLNDSRIAAELDLPRTLCAAAIEVLTIRQLGALDEPARRDAIFAADLGIAAPDWVIAETGSLVYAADFGQTRSATLLPAIHLAVVDSRTIVADLFDLPDCIIGKSDGGVLPRNVAIVTGPSKTGDIELKLTTGVHGPGEVHVFIWDRS